jgi:hypothetical protein
MLLMSYRYLKKHRQKPRIKYVCIVIEEVRLPCKPVVFRLHLRNVSETPIKA